MAKLRLILQQRYADADGRNAGAEYHTADVETPDELKGYEIIGGEWLQEPRELGGQIQENWKPDPLIDDKNAPGYDIRPDPPFNSLRGRTTSGG